MWAETICFEQPVNEHVRAYLRLEYLFKYASYSLKGTSEWDNRTTIATIFDILSILDRPDLKTKLNQEINRHLLNFSRLEQAEHIDQKKLSEILIELEDISDVLQATMGRIGQELRDNEFLSSIRLHLNSPGGTCDFNTPAYSLWLKQSAEQRTQDLTNWLNSFHIIRLAIHLLLRLIRQSAAAQLKTAQEGFYQAPLDPQIACQLIRVHLPAGHNIFPEISVGRHGICIRYFNFTTQGTRPTQTSDNIPFKLTICAL